MSKLWTLVLLAALSVGSSGQRSAFDHDRKPERARVQVIATSYRTLHGTSGGQDVCITEMELRGQPEHEALLVDGFRDPSVAIDLIVLAERKSLEMLVARDPQCDRKSAEIVRPRSAQDVYDPDALREIDKEPDQLLPCYRTLHESIRLAKH